MDPVTGKSKINIGQVYQADVTFCGPAAVQCATPVVSLPCTVSFHGNLAGGVMRTLSDAGRLGQSPLSNTFK
jgi:hypothetical protein